MRLELTVPWEESLYEIDVVEFTQKWRDDVFKFNTIELRFKNKEDGREYKYTWSSNPQSGNSFLYIKNKYNFDLVSSSIDRAVCDPKYTNLHEIARQSSVIIKQKTTPK